MPGAWWLADYCRACDERPVGARYRVDDVRCPTCASRV